MPDNIPTDFDKLWDYHDPAATELKFRELLPAAEASNDPSRLAQLLTQIARAQGLQRKFDDAHGTLNRVQQMLPGAGELARVRYLLERGRVFNSSGQAATARPLFEEAFKVASAASFDSCAVDAAHMIAIVEPDPTLQLDWNLRALDLAERSADEGARTWRASLSNNIGWTYFDLKQFDQALEIFEKAIALRAAQSKPRELRIARYCVAKTLRMLGRIDEATDITRDLVSQAETAGDPDGYFFEELAECLLAGGKSDEARPHFQRAFDALSQDKWLAESEPERLARLKTLAEST